MCKSAPMSENIEFVVLKVVKVGLGRMGMSSSGLQGTESETEIGLFYKSVPRSCDLTDYVHLFRGHGSRKSFD